MHACVRKSPSFSASHPHTRPLSSPLLYLSPALSPTQADSRTCGVDVLGAVEAFLARQAALGRGEPPLAQTRLLTGSHVEEIEEREGLEDREIWAISTPADVHGGNQVSSLWADDESGKMDLWG